MINESKILELIKKQKKTGRNIMRFAPTKAFQNPTTIIGEKTQQGTREEFYILWRKRDEEKNEKETSGYPIKRRGRYISRCIVLLNSFFLSEVR